MTLNRHSLALGLAVFLLMTAAVSTAFLMPPTPDLMARAAVIHDFGGPAKFDRFQWMDKNHLVATSVASTPFPSVISINIDSKSIAILPHVTDSLREIMTQFHSDELNDAIPSPDGSWILFDLSMAPTAKDIACAVRVDNGHVVADEEKGSNGPVRWLANSRDWVEVQDNDLFVHALAGKVADHVIPAPGLYDEFIKSGNFQQLNPILGKERVFSAREYRSGKTLDEEGVVSPDGKRIAWLYQSAWPRGFPVKLRPLLIACRYPPQLHGEVWTTRIDGMDRHEIGSLNAQSPFPIDEWNFDWTPDGKSLIFSRGGILYSVPVSTP